jgi:hypothetical protein
MAVIRDGERVLDRRLLLGRGLPLLHQEKGWIMKRGYFTGTEAQVFHRCMRHEAGLREGDFHGMKTNPPVPLERRREIAEYAAKLADILRG